MQANSNSTVHSLAVKLSEAFQTQKRSDGHEFVSLKDASPAWMTGVVRSVHGDKLPDDTVYGMIERCVDALTDANEDADLYEVIQEIESDIYTTDLTAWLHARVDHVYYLTEVLEEGTGITDGFQLLAVAQQKQLHEVGYALVSALEDVPEDADAESEAQ